MTLDPGYGETPLPFDELDFLLPEARMAIGEPVTREAVYDLEQAVGERVWEQLLIEVLSGKLTLEDILTDYFLRELHYRLYGDIWSWAGQYRHYMFNIGVDWEKIPEEVRNAIDNIQYRWKHTNDWSPKKLGIAAHAELVRIHPFTDGNGRSTRLFADLLFVSAQDNAEIELYDWQIDKTRYIKLLREYDQDRDPSDLSEFISIYKLE